MRRGLILAIGRAGSTIVVDNPAIGLICYSNLRATGRRAAFEDIIDDVDGVADVHRQIPIGVSRLERGRGRSPFEDVIDDIDGVADIDSRIVIGIAAEIGQHRDLPTNKDRQDGRLRLRHQH